MSAAESTSAKASPARPRRRRFGQLRWLALTFPLGLALLFVPAIFQFVLRDVIIFEAWRHSASIHIGDVRGSLFEPITIANVQWMGHGADGTVTRLEIARAEAEFAWRWRELASGSGKRWFRRLTLDGVTGKSTITAHRHRGFRSGGRSRAGNEPKPAPRHLASGAGAPGSEGDQLRHPDQ